MVSTEPQEHQLLVEINRLRQDIETLKRENNDLRIALATTAEHGDVIEEELQTINDRLRTEVEERQRAQSLLQAFVSVVSKQRDDLEIILHTIVEHGDVLDTQWQEKVSQANLLAISDSLTQIPNRRRFDDYLESQWQRMTREQTPLSVMLCDVDFFKQYNDTYGHLAGDACLKQIVQALSSSLFRASDVLARYGGEEFAAILPHTDQHQAVNVAQRMQVEIARLQIPHVGSTINSYVTLSIGIACTIPIPSRSPSMLLEAVDRQLYLAKQRGRNQIVHQFLE